MMRSHFSITLMNCKTAVSVKPFVRMKSVLPISWERPEKLPPHHPSKSGDLKKRADIDLTRFPHLFSESEELKTADENVKRIFSLRFQKQRVANQILKHDLADKVRSHKLDYTSREVKIALLTGAIRNLTQYVEPLRRKQVPGPIRTNMKEMIDMRKKHLRLLRQADYKLFEWILDELDLEFKPKPLVLERVERKQSMRKLTDQYCENVRNDRLAELRAEFEAKQIPFLEEKLAKLQWIRENESKYELPETVTEEDIENARKRLEELKLKRNENEKQLESSN
ncbi:hypothetical protein LSTR_LSTR012851 [Laodelphax striatellus]|uniref:Small ribosomal subunit protein uS15m n=1 Tax=Laodelphax striatellus TaxID=195883 RepID=A0A482XB22_LAOST|nr:hypothetical protein LSTR_LSTR012851 [Laodelphax striatellus]